MKRRLISLNLALILLLSLLPSMVIPAMAAGDCGYATYHKNDGSGIISATDVQKYFAVTSSNFMLYTAMPFSNTDDAVITSYNSKADGTGTKYALTSRLRQSYTTDENNPGQLYAQWEDAPGNYTLYISSTGYTTADGKDYVLDTNQPIPFTLRGGDTFSGGSDTWKIVGWDMSNPSASNPDFIVGDYTTRTDLTLYSVWGSNAIKFHYRTYNESLNLYYNTTSISRYTNTYQMISYGSPSSVTAENSVFVGWNTKEDGTGEWWAESDYAYKAPNELYAIFEEITGNTCLISAYPYSLPGNGPMRDLIYLSASTDQVTLPGDASDVWVTDDIPTYLTGYVHEQSDLYTGGMTIDVNDGDVIEPLDANLQVSFIENYEGHDEVVTYYDMSYPSYLSFSSAEEYFNELPKNVSFTGWNTKADGTGRQYAVGGYATIGNLTLYAQWYKIPPVTPEVPTITVTTSASSGKPVISWTAVEHATGYEVWRSGSKNGTYTKLITTDDTKLSVTHTGAEVGEDCFYKVRALNEDLTSEYSEIKGVWCDLPRPTITVTNRASDGKPTISWTAVEGATGYEVYRSGSKDGDYVKMYTASATKLSVTHTGAAVGNDYFYKVVAVYGTNTKCNSASSVIKGIWCDLKRPTVSVITNTTSGKPVISWDAVDYAVGYKVYCATGSSTGTYKLIYNGSTNPDKLSVTHVGAEAGTAYYYKVVAVHKNSKCTSAYSVAKGVYCDLAQPTLTVELNSNGKPYLTWTESAGADSYKVYRSTDNSTWNLLYTAESTDFDVTHTGAVAGTTYYYKVRAICNETSKGNSAYSAVQSITAE